MGYHLKNICRGEVGQLSKIQEELEEAIDAEDQANMVMVLIELSDIIGAVECYLEDKFDGVITLEDLVTMARATRRAFLSGARKCRDLNTTSTPQ